MSEFIKKFPDLIVIFILYGPALIWSKVKGEPINYNVTLTILLTLIWVRLVLITFVMKGWDENKETINQWRKP